LDDAIQGRDRNILFMTSTTIDKSRLLQARFFEFAAQCILVSRCLSRSPESWVIRSQLVRSATSVAANYRAACRALSRRGFVAKLSIALEEADEVVYWLQLSVRVELLSKETITPLDREGDELIRILSASRKTARNRQLARSSNRQTRRSTDL
jgi:four helix bundle protein